MAPLKEYITNCTVPVEIRRLFPNEILMSAVYDPSFAFGERIVFGYKKNNALFLFIHLFCLSVCLSVLFGIFYPPAVFVSPCIFLFCLSLSLPPFILSFSFISPSSPVGHPGCACKASIARIGSLPSIQACRRRRLRRSPRVGPGGQRIDPPLGCSVS